MTKTAPSGSSATMNISETINAVAESQRAAQEAALAASAAAVETFQTQEAILIANIEAASGQLAELHVGLESVGVEEFSVPDLSGIDYLFTNTIRSAPKGKGKGKGPGRPRKNAAKSSAPSTSANPRGSKPCSLPDAILIGMNQEERGHEFSIIDVTVAVQAEPVSYPFSGSDNSTSVTVRQRLRGLIDDKLVRKVSHGVYAITATGQKSATIALTELKATVELEAAE